MRITLDFGQLFTATKKVVMFPFQALNKLLLSWRQHIIYWAVTGVINSLGVFNIINFIMPMNTVSFWVGTLALIIIVPSIAFSGYCIYLYLKSEEEFAQFVSED